MPDQQAVELAAAHDAAEKATIPSSVPEGWEGYRFVVPNLPVNGLFTIALRNGGEVLGPFRSEDWFTDPATGITTAHDESTGAPIVLRVIDQPTDKPTKYVSAVLTCVDDDGLTYEVIVEEIPDNQLEIEDA